jgi:4-hydroxy-tetrahydrodipicolinate synthase
MTDYQIKRGVWTALVTPFEEDGSIDWKSFESLLLGQIAAHVTGVVLCGTTGESSTLALQEKLSLVRKAKALSEGKISIMAGVGSSNTQQTVELARLAVDAGAESLLVVTPPYTKPSINGLMQHFEAIAEAITVPLCLYHVPSRTAQTLTAEQLSRLCSIPKVGAVKEASGNLILFSQSLMKSDAAYFSGDDFTYLPSLAVGSSGVISVVSNLYPQAMVSLTNAAFAADFSLARKYHTALMPILEALFSEPNPCPLKAALSIRKLCKNSLRLPLAAIETQTYRRVEEAMKQADLQLSNIGG